jgi:4-hydroxybenzoate polyprenyltransferase
LRETTTAASERTVRDAAQAALDAAAFSSGLAAGVAIALTLAAAAAMGAVDPAWEAALLAGAGTLCIYNVDRLRDRERDRLTAPLRTAFVERHQLALRWAAALGASVAAVLVCLLVWRVGAPVLGLCAVVAALGLLHRRLKHVPLFKSLYVSGAWLAITVGVPALLLPSALHVGWICAALGGPLLGNLIVSSLRDGENLAGRVPPGRALLAARLTTAAGAGLALLGPIPALAWVGTCSYLSLLGFRGSERYGMTIVDGALGIGGFAAFLALQ